MERSAGGRNNVTNVTYFFKDFQTHLFCQSYPDIGP